MKKYKSQKEAVSVIQSGHRVFIHGAAATPIRLINALVKESERLKDVELFHLHTIGSAGYVDAAHRDHFKVSTFFIGANMRNQFNAGHVDYIPCFLSEIPQLF